MEKSLSDYDQSLEELDRQKEHLELVMKKMGEEWAESGAGVGWMGSLPEFDATKPPMPTLQDEALLSSSGSSSSGKAEPPTSPPTTPDEYTAMRAPCLGRRRSSVTVVLVPSSLRRRQRRRSRRPCGTEDGGKQDGDAGGA